MSLIVIISGIYFTLQKAFSLLETSFWTMSMLPNCYRWTCNGQVHDTGRCWGLHTDNHCTTILLPISPRSWRPKGLCHCHKLKIPCCYGREDHVCCYLWNKNNYSDVCYRNNRKHRDSLFFNHKKSRISPKLFFVSHHLFVCVM